MRYHCKYKNSLMGGTPVIRTVRRVKMKREELLEKGYTEEQVTELLNMWHESNANITKENEKLKTDVATMNEKISGLNQKVSGLTKKEEELNAIKQAQLSDEEKMAMKQKEIEENLRKSRITLNTAKAREIFSELGGIDEDILSSIVTEDEQTTISNANNWLNKIKSIKEETVNKTKEEMSTLDLKPAPSNNLESQDGMTWEKFDSLSSDEQTKFAEEHPDEFARL